MVPCSFPGCDRPAARTGDTGACRVHVSAVRQRARGLVSVPDAARILRVDRRVIERLFDAGEIEGERGAGDGATTWLKRRSLAAYFWSRPRCIRDDCGRRVIGDGPGCDRHRRSGRHHSEDTRRKMSEAQGGSVPVEKICEWCGKPFVGRGDRFCGKSHSTASRNVHGPDAGHRQRRLQEGNAEHRALVKRVKAERRLLGIEDLVDRPADKDKPKDKPFRAGRLRQAGVPRTAAAISGYIRDGRLGPERDLGFDEPQLFAEAAVDELVNWLRTHRPDGTDRRRGPQARYNATTPEQATARGAWYQARHKSSAENGRLASRINKPGPKSKVTPEAEAEIRQLSKDGNSLREIEALFEGGVTLKQIRRVLAASGD